MQALVAAILAVVTIASTPDGAPIYAPHFRDTTEGPQHRAEELAELFILAQEAYGVDAYRLRSALVAPGGTASW